MLSRRVIPWCPLALGTLQWASRLLILYQHVQMFVRCIYRTGDTFGVLYVLVWYLWHRCTATWKQKSVDLRAMAVSGVCLCQEKMRCITPLAGAERSIEGKVCPLVQ